jgi:hypothetical protein
LKGYAGGGKEGRRRGCRGLCLSWRDEEIAQEQAFTAHFLEFKEQLSGFSIWTEHKAGQTEKARR